MKYILSLLALLLFASVLFDGQAFHYATIEGINVFTGVNSFSSSVSFGVKVTSPTYSTTTNCAQNGSPAACGSSAAGAFSCPVGGVTCVVNSSAITANSEIFVQPSAAASSRLGITCNSTSDTGLTMPRLAGQSVGTFTINLGSFSTNPECFSFFVVN